MLGRKRQNMTDYEIEGGDLGLGRGLKPGALPKNEATFEFTPTDIIRYSACANNILSTTETEIHIVRCLQDALIDTQRSQIDTDNYSVTDTENEYDSKSSTTTTGCEHEADSDSKNRIPIGTTLQQQKQLFYSDLDFVRRQINCPQDDNSKSTTRQKTKVYQKEMKHEKQLQKAKKEIECLQKDLSQCRDQLTSKVKVIQMLRSRFLASQMEDENVICKLKRLNRSLQQDVNRLMFDMEHKDSSVMTSQQTWAKRFDSLVTENTVLHDVMHDKTEDMRQMYLSNIALQRDKDELLALLEVKEKQRYEAVSSPRSVHNYNNFSSLELAVLGACKCIQPNSDPCNCAQIAANLKRDIRQLTDSVEMHRKHHQEALVTVDAYRSAFEEQLSRNKSLVKKMADYAIMMTPVSTKPSAMEERMDSAKAVLKFLIQTTIGDVPPQTPSTFPAGSQLWSCAGVGRKGTEAEATADQLTGKTQEELTQILVEMMSDRSEALAHHRLAARFLAQRTHELEEKLARYAQPQTSTADDTEDSRQDIPCSSTASGLLNSSSSDGSSVQSASGL